MIASGTRAVLRAAATPAFWKDSDFCREAAAISDNAKEYIEHYKGESEEDDVHNADRGLIDIEADDDGTMRDERLVAYMQHKNRKYNHLTAKHFFLFKRIVIISNMMRINSYGNPDWGRSAYTFGG
jgi:hypothetical protein